MTLTVDNEIWEKFNTKVEKREGTTYGKLSPIITGLIQDYYLDEKAATTIEDSMLQQENEKLTTQLNEIKKEQEKLQKSNDKLLQENKKLQDNTKEADTDKIKDLENQIATLTQQIKEKTK